MADAGQENYQQRGERRRSSVPPNASVWDRFLWDFKLEDMWGSDRYKETERLKREAMDRLLFLSKDDTVGDLLSLLTKHGILSAPIYDDDANMFAGSVDVLDLVTYCVKQMGRGTLIDDTYFKRTPVGKIVNISGRNRWRPIDRRAPLRILFDTLSLPDVHRVPVVDNKEGKPEQKVLGLVTQSQVLGWLWEQREKEGFPQDIRRLKLKNWKSPVICGTDMLWLVEKETALAEAFHTIKRQRVTGVGVVNEAGELMGNVSASDIKVGVASGKQLLDMLTMSLEQFLTLKGSLMIDIDRPLSHRQPITATPEDTMEQVLEKLITHRIHRLWIVESDGEGDDADVSSPAGEQSRKRTGRVPIGCVSLCDVLNELASFESSELYVPRVEGVEEGYVEDEEDEENESDYLEEVEAGRRKRSQKTKPTKKKAKKASNKKGRHLLPSKDKSMQQEEAEGASTGPSAGLNPASAATTK
jgi:CBS domain-containing protein